MENKQIMETADNGINSADAAQSQISIMDIINMMLKHWWVIAISAIVLGGAMFAYSTLTHVPVYVSSATLYINTQTEQKTEDVNVSSLQNAQELMPTYIEVLRSDPFMQTISDDTDNKYDQNTIKGMVSYAAQSETNILQVTARSTDSHDAYLIAESVSKNAPDEIRRVFEGGSVKLINNAKEALAPLPDDSAKKGFIGFVAGAAIAALIIFLINIFDTRVKSTEELTTKYHLPILGEVPNLHED